MRSAASAATGPLASAGASSATRILAPRLATSTTTSSARAAMLEVGVHFCTFLIELRLADEWLHRWHDASGDVVPDLLLIFELGDFRPESQNVNDAHRTVGFHEDRGSFGTVAIQQPVHTHDVQTSCGQRGHSRRSVTGVCPIGREAAQLAIL